MAAGQPAAESDTGSLRRFDRLRTYARQRLAPWRRDGARLLFLTARPTGAAPDIPVTDAALAAALRREFANALTAAAVNGLAECAPAESARRVVTAPQAAGAALAVLVIVALAIAAPRAVAGAFVAVIAAAFTVMIAVRVGLAAIAAAPRPARTRRRLEDEDLPTVTILVPLFREAPALAGLVASLARLDYPAHKLDIKLLLEAGDEPTIAEARRLDRDEGLDLVIVPPSAPQTKPKACNYALPTARGDLLVIYDAEDEPEPSQLRLAAETFAAADHNLACVQARLNFYNADENWLTRLFTLEYCLWFDHLLPALDRLGAPVPLGGTSNIFRTEALIEAGGWDPYNVTEDADLGLRLARRGWKTAVIDSTTYEEANCRLPNWLRQRSRWMKGFMQTWLVHRRGAPAAAAGGWRTVLSVDLFIGGAVAAALANPFLWGLSLAEWLTGTPGGGLLPGPAGAIAATSLALGNFI